MSRHLCTLVEAADRLHTSEATLRYWINRDTMRAAGEERLAPPSFKLGRRRMFDSDQLDAWIADRMAASASA